MKVPVLLMCSLHAPTQQALEATYEVHRYYEAADPKALLASLAGRSKSRSPAVAVALKRQSCRSCLD